MEQDEVNIPPRGRPRKPRDVNFAALEGEGPDRMQNTNVDFERMFESEEESVNDLLQKEYRKCVDRNSLEINRNSLEINKNNLESYLKLNDLNRKWNVRNEGFKLDPRRNGDTKRGMIQSQGQIMSHISSIFPEKNLFTSQNAQQTEQEKAESSRETNIDGENMFQTDPERGNKSPAEDSGRGNAKRGVEASDTAGMYTSREEEVRKARQQENEFYYAEKRGGEYGTRMFCDRPGNAQDEDGPDMRGDVGSERDFVQRHGNGFRTSSETFLEPRMNGCFYTEHQQSYPKPYNLNAMARSPRPYPKMSWNGFSWQTEKESPYPPRNFGREGYPGGFPTHSLNGHFFAYQNDRENFQKGMGEHFGARQPVERPGGGDFIPRDKYPMPQAERRDLRQYPPRPEGGMDPDFYRFQDSRPFFDSRARPCPRAGFDTQPYGQQAVQEEGMADFMGQKYATGTSLGQTLSHSSNVSNFEPDPNNPLFQNYSIWVNRKKRKNNPLLWQYINQHSNLMHPSKYSSLDYVHKKMYLGTITQLPVEKNNHQILPLFLNSASKTPEFVKIGNIFLERANGLNYDNVTVMQLKNLMKEFGLCHNGKKTELIERVRGTAAKIEMKMDGKKMGQQPGGSPEAVEEPSPEEGKDKDIAEDATFMYF